MTEPVRIEIPSLGRSAAQGQAGSTALSPLIVSEMLCAVQRDIQGAAGETAKAAAASVDVSGKLDAVVDLLGRIATAVEASAARIDAATDKLDAAASKLDLRVWAAETVMREQVHPAMDAARAAVEADTAARQTPGAGGS